MITKNEPTTAQVDAALNYTDAGADGQKCETILAAEVRRLRAQLAESKEKTERYRLVTLSQDARIAELVSVRYRLVVSMNKFRALFADFAALRSHILRYGTGKYDLQWTADTVELMRYKSSWLALERKVEDAALHMASRCDDGETCVYIVAMRGTHYTGSTLIAAVDAAMEGPR